MRRPKRFFEECASDGKRGMLLPRDTPPPYKAAHLGDAERGKQVYASACARCHGATARSPERRDRFWMDLFSRLIERADDTHDHHCRPP